MPKKITIFISYCHQDSQYLQDDSLFGFLKGLQEDGVEFWWDGRIATGDLWDDEIKAKIADSDIALTLVSQAFLNSSYCIDVEIRRFLKQKTRLIPLILSACEWQRHEWLQSRQFLPGGDQTVEEHYTDLGRRKRLFLMLLEQLRKQVEKLQSINEANPAAKNKKIQPSKPVSTLINPFTQTLAIREAALFVGREAELRRLRSLLDGGSAALLGESKIGKSSVIWRLAESWEGKVLGPIDFQGIEDRDDFFETLAAELQAADSHWQALRRTLRETRALLLLDELDIAPDRGVDGDDMAKLRSVCNHNPAFKMLTASRNAVKELYPDRGKGSPGFNLLSPLTLDEMSEPEARCLLAHPWASGASVFDEAAIVEILALAGRHPFKLQRAAFHRYEVFSDPDYDWKTAWRQDMEQML